MSIPILDCHQHLIYPDRLAYSWTADIPQLVGKAFTYEDYLSLVADAGPVRTIFMETSPDDSHWQDEAQLVMELADAPDTIIDGLVLNCRPEADGDFDQYIESIRHPKLVGLRRSLHVMPDDLSQDDRFIANVRKMAAQGLTFDLCVLARQIHLGAALARQCANVQFVLDHCGVPDIAGGDIDRWRVAIREIAACENVVCKISGLLAYCDPRSANVETIRPYVEHCIACFGWDRVIWGSDWPVVCVTRDLPSWIAASRELLAEESSTHQHQLFHKNAERIYLGKE